MFTHVLRKHLPLLFALGILLVSGCGNDKTGSLFDPNYQSPRSTPNISSISPTSGLAGVSILTVTGTNFSPVPSENTVYFDTKQAQVLEATSTQLKVKAPDLAKDSIKVRVAVFQSEFFSNTMSYKLEAAVAEFGNLQSSEEPYGITTDATGNVYVSMINNSVGAGIKKFTPAGVRNDYAPASGVLKWSALKMGPNGVLYAARIVRALFTIPAGGGTPTLWVGPSDGVGTVYDFDFDAQGNIWAGGNNSSIYRIKLDKSIKAFDFNANVRTVRVYNGYLYVGGNVDPTEGIWRAQIISADSLGPFTKHFDFSAAYPGPGVYALTFAADGDMYIGTDADAALVVVHPNKSFEPVYPGLFKPQSLLLAWGAGNTLYVVRSGAVASHTMIKVNMQKNGAPYYGR